MSEEPHRIEMYQELVLLFPVTSRESVCALLERRAPSTKWHRATAIEERIGKNCETGDDGVIAFKGASKGTLVVSVVLWPADENENLLGKKGLRYRLGNIVPVESGELGVHGYNDALEGFLRDVVEPAAEVLGVEIEVSPRQQTMTDWTSTEAAAALRRFSVAANMSTGASHPEDEARWRAFVMADHRAQGTLRAGLLREWLIEADGWHADTASELVSDWEKGRELLSDWEKGRELLEA